jgi:phage shock protein A
MGFWDIFKRGSKVLEANANAALEKVEDPSVMTSQALLDLNSKLDNAINAQATYKSMIIGLKAKQVKKDDEKTEWITKAGKLQDRIDEDSSKTESIEPLIITALENSKNCENESNLLLKNIATQESKYSALVAEITKLRELILKTKENLVSLKTRQEVAEASVQINKELSDIAGLGSTKDLIDRMEEKVTKKESLAQAYAGIDKDSETNETKIDELLKTETATSSADILASFRSNRKK